MSEPCVDGRLTLGAALSAAACAAVSLAWGSPVAAIVQAAAGIALAVLAVRAGRVERPAVAAPPTAPRSSAVADAVATLAGDGPRHVAN